MSMVMSSSVAADIALDDDEQSQGSLIPLKIAGSWFVFDVAMIEGGHKTRWRLSD